MRIILCIIFLVRLSLSLITYNADIHNHQAWMESVQTHGWSGLYERDLSPWAKVNYPPATLYTFWLAEKIYSHTPESLQTNAVHATMYKLPSLVADCLVAWLIWHHTKWKQKIKLAVIGAYLVSPALAYNSVWWGQIESLVTFFCIYALILLSNNKPAQGLIVFTFALLSKQNALPLIPVMVSATWLSHMRLKSLAGSALVSISLFMVAYLPLIPQSSSAITYPFTTYIASVGGQPHQWQASVNALNYWYLLNMNQENDNTTILGPFTARQFSLFLTGAGLLIALYVGYHLRHNKLRAITTAAAITFLWTFTFATRMHERHGYMMIACLTLLLPYMKYRPPYYALSLISFYNLYSVWQEDFVLNQGVTSWENMTSALALATVLMTLSSVFWLGVVPSKSHKNEDYE